MDISIFQRVFYNNTVGDYLYSLAVLLAGILLIRIMDLIFHKLFIKAEKRALQRAKEQAKTISRFTSWSGMYFSKLSKLRLETKKRLLKQVFFPIVFMAFFAYALFTLEFPPERSVLVNKIFYSILFVILLRAVLNSAEIAFLRFSQKESRLDAAKSIKPLLSIFKIIIWIFGLIFLFGNLGFDVSTMLAGLGISGIAIAIAAQGILGDLFGYLVILFDKPFTIGDLITVEGNYGWVEKIGIKTTHLRTLHGEILIVSNTTLSSMTISNYSNMQHRRAVFSVGVTYDTTQEHVEMIPSLIEGIINAISTVEGVVFDRCHLKEFGNFSLNFETVYFLPIQDMKAFMDVQQEINREIFRKFNELGIEFAFPTQTLYHRNVGESKS